MSTDGDKIEALFEDLVPKPKDFPGKREPQLRQQQFKKRGTQPIESWDSGGRTKMLNGVAVEFFPIRNVALALNRSARTIRDWEIREIIPPATFRSTKPHKTKQGIKEVGDRLWTRAQIEAMVKAAQEEGVLAGKPPTKAFTVKVVKAFLALQKQHTATT